MNGQRKPGLNPVREKLKLEDMQKLINEEEKHSLFDEEWLKDQQCWMQDVKEWHHQSRLLMVLLYKLEKALPEHSLKLSAHKRHVEQHKEDLNRYHHRLETQKLLESSMDEKKQIYENIKQEHDRLRDEHEAFSKAYHEQLERFHQLAVEFIHELDEFL